jgi:TetR/AcrR family transcriptional regulator, ethionamide resistance regulator
MPEPRKRRRRTPDAAEAEILDAAEQLLRRVPFVDLTIDRLMAATGLSRPSFYQYFTDLYELLAKLAERHVKVVSQITSRYADYIFGISGKDLVSEEAAAVRHANFVELCKEHRRHRHFHRLLIQSSALDLRGRRIYRNYIRAMGQNAAGLIRQLQRRGIARSLNPDETGLALHLMMEFYMLEKVVEAPASNFEKVAETLTTIWEKVIYGELPARRPAATRKSKGESTKAITRGSPRQ